MEKEEYKRKLSAILSADVAGYSLLMRDDEAATVRTITTYRKALTQLIQQYRGRVVDSPGDNILAVFNSVVDSVNCAVEIQRELSERNAELPDDRRMQFRIGINLGDVIIEGERIYGDGVNIAARLEGLADVGGICISGTVYDAIESKIGLEYFFIGEQEVKNIDKPVRAYRVLSYPGAAAYRVVKAKQAESKKWRKLILITVAAVIVVVAVGPIVWNHFFEPPVLERAPFEKMAFPLPDKPSLAVLPFTNMSEDPEQDFFADGMTDELITNLSKISGLLVISRNSSFFYKGKTIPIKQVVNELDVKYVLEGSIQRVGDRVRIRAQLIDGASDHHIWAESYDAIMEDIFDLQDKITKNIASILAVKLTTNEQNRLETKETTSIQAYDAFVKGWEYLHRETPDELEQAISLFEEAIELDPMYSRAQAALAWAYLNSSTRFKWQDFIEPHHRLMLMARKHLELAMRNPTSTSHLVASKMALFRRQYEESFAQAEFALAFDANDPESNLNMAMVFMATGKPEKALEFVNKTLQLDPRNMGAPLAAAGMAYFILGDLQKAATMTERAIDHNPTIAGRYESLSAIYALLGRIQDAQVARDESMKEWDFGRFTADLTTVMSFFLVKDRQVVDRYADGLIKAGWLGNPSEYYKIYEENKLTGEEIRNLVSGQEITIHDFDRIYWIDHTKKGRAKDISRLREGKWWIEDDMLCYQMESGTVKGLKDCGEMYRNPDSLPGSEKQYLYVTDFSIIAVTTKN
jgi:TolB-like protein/class 3 adenylate cyclase